jgi:hypothetical protein
MRVTAYLIAPESNTFVAGTRSRGNSAIQGFAKKSGGKGRSQARKAKSLAGNNKIGCRCSGNPSAPLSTARRG